MELSTVGGRRATGARHVSSGTISYRAELITRAKILGRQRYKEDALPEDVPSPGQGLETVGMEPTAP